MLSDVAAVLILSAAAGCGIGGGGLLVVYMTLFLDMGQISAQASNLLMFIISASSSAAVQKRRHTLPPMKLILLCSSCAVPGVFLGTYLRNFFNESDLKTFFGVVLILAGLSVLFGNARRAVRYLLRAKKKKYGKKMPLNH